MITSERQYRNTKNWVNRFVEALAEFEAEAGKRIDLHPRLVQAEQEAMEAQLAELREEMEEYERVRDAGASGQAVGSGS